MKSVLYLTSSSQLKTFKEKNVGEVILEAQALSRFGKLSVDTLNDLAAQAKADGFKVALEWDILMLDSFFQKALVEIKKINLDNIDAIRVQDPGAIHWCLQNTTKPLHLNLETGNHNLLGLDSWLDLDRKRIEKVILSIEWSKGQLEKLIPKLGCQVELLVMGRILLFYTPRYLLNVGLSERESTLEIGNANHWLEASGQSEESPHKGFPLLENQHGTFMFLPKDHCLLAQTDELKELGITNVRIDNRFMKDELTSQCLDHLKNPNDESFEKIKELTPQKLIRGFYSINKSDVLFKKLKNYRIQRQDDDYLGSVLEVNKKNYLAIRLKNPKEKLTIGSKLKIITPEGKIKKLSVHFLKNCRGDNLESASSEDLVFINHTGGVSTRAAVYYDLAEKSALAKS